MAEPEGPTPPASLPSALALSASSSCTPAAAQEGTCRGLPLRTTFTLLVLPFRLQNSLGKAANGKAANGLAANGHANGHANGVH